MGFDCLDAVKAHTCFWGYTIHKKKNAVHVDCAHDE